MFGKNAAKQQMQLAQTAQQQQNQYMQLASQPNPLQAAEDKENLDFINWESGKSGPIDIRNAPGMGPDLALYNNAIANHDEDMAGTGLIRMGLNGADPNYLAQLDRLYKDRRQQRAAGALENAYRAHSARVHGYVLPSSELSQSRSLSLASLASGNASNGWTRYLDQMNKSGFFNSNLFNQYMATARTAAAAGARKGGAWDKYIGRPVLTGEEGFELAVGDDGKVQPLGVGGPELVIPQKPAVVIPHEQSAQMVADNPYLRMMHEAQGDAGVLGNFQYRKGAWRSSRAPWARRCC